MAASLRNVRRGRDDLRSAIGTMTTERRDHGVQPPPGTPAENAAMRRRRTHHDQVMPAAPDLLDHHTDRLATTPVMRPSRGIGAPGPRT
jgi:hypothetical protein